MRRLAVATVLVASCDEAGAPEQPIAAALDTSPKACARCHAEITDEWRSSMHARAWDDPVFRAEYDAQPAQSCRDCHAPASSAPGRATGVDCASCHVRDGDVLAIHVTEAGQRAHAMRVDPALRGQESCAACHQFAFTDDGVHDPLESLQSTVDEYRASEAFARGETCTDCHMTRGGGHAFGGIHDPEQLARAVDVHVTARRSGDALAIDVRVRGARIGHAFPTGDVFRSAVLGVQTNGGARAEIVMQRWLARTVDPDHRGFHVRTVDDTRVPPPGQGELVESLTLPDDGTTEVAWELVLHRLPPWRAAQAELAPDLVTRQVASGRVAVER